MASAASLFDAGTIADRWIADYCAARHEADVLCADDAAWAGLFEELAQLAGDSLEPARERAQRHAADIGTGFRIAGEGEERPWPLSPVPLLIAEAEWQGIAAGIAQRAQLMERVLADIYGSGALIADGRLPAALVTGSPFFLRPLAHLDPPGGHHLQFAAFDLCRGPGGEWRVLADHLRNPAGAGYALENRLAMARTLGGLQTRLNMARHAPFFAAFRDGIAACCRRADPRIGLLTPGRLNPSYAEQAHLARYLGFLLVEGADLTALDDKLYLRTIAGLKRVDAVWHRLDPRLLDPLALDSHSTIGVPGLIDAMAAGDVVVANAPGAGVLEAPAFAAFAPALAEALGEPLALPNIATWWCGQDAERAYVEAHLDSLLVGPAFGVPTLGLPDGKPVLGGTLAGEARAALLADMARRPQDYVGQEVVRLSTMPVVAEDRLVPRPFTLRVFAARDADGAWTVLPGGFARIAEHPDARAALMGEGSWSADVCVHGPDPVDPVSLLPSGDSTQLRRNPGTLPSRVADNMFWLGRYLERGEALLGLIRVLLGHSISADTGAALSADTVGRLARLIAWANAAPEPRALKRADLTQLARTALEDDGNGWNSVRAINARARDIGAVSRERLSADMIRLLDAPFPARGSLLDRAGSLQRRYSALAGLAAEHMGRTDAWRFHDMGRRVERAVAAIGFIRAFGGAQATSDDLSTLLDLADSQISYRQRYLTGMARVPVLDLVTLDGGNPRGVAFQVAAISAHLNALPLLSDDGLAEPQQEQARALAAMLVTAHATRIDDNWFTQVADRLARISDAISRRYFLQGAEPLRAAGMVLA